MSSPKVKQENWIGNIPWSNSFKKIIFRGLMPKGKRCNKIDNWSSNKDGKNIFSPILISKKGQNLFTFSTFECKEFSVHYRTLWNHLGNSSCSFRTLTFSRNLIWINVEQDGKAKLFYKMALKINILFKNSPEMKVKMN